MIESEIIIPQGWTYFAHRTNTDKWNENPFNKSEIEVKKLMCVVTEREIYHELNDYGKNYLLGYTSGKGTPFEIRTLICDLNYIQSLDKDSEIRKIMLKEFYYDKNNFGGAYGQRHHSIPSGEELIVLGVSNYDEVFERQSNIIWTISKRLLDFYNSETLKNNN